MKLPLKKTQAQKRRGFTIIEAFVGITILLIGLVGPLMLVNSNLQAGRFSRDQITAYYLAQEAIEMVREVRDENFLEGDDWLDGLSSCLGSNTCRLDGHLKSFIPCSDCTTNPTRYPLRVDRTNGRYGYSSASAFTDSRFYRYVQVREEPGGDGATVRVVIGFDTGRYTQEYTTVDYIRDWSPL